MKSAFTAAIVVAAASAATLDHEGNVAMRAALTRTRRPRQTSAAPSRPAPRPAPAPVMRAPEPAPAPVMRAPEPKPEPAPVMRAPEPKPAPAPVMRAPEPAPAPVMRAPEPKPEPAPVMRAPEPMPAPAPAPVMMRPQHPMRAPEPMPTPVLRPTPVTPFTPEPRLEAAVQEGGVNAILARLLQQRELASMARDLEDCYPTDGGLKNSWWRPTTVVKPGRAWATIGEGPVYNKDECSGKVRGGNHLTYQWRTNQATRPAAYPYARTLLETRQPTQWRSGPYRRAGYGYQPKKACDYGCKQATY